MLVEAGADLNICNESGCFGTSLHYAIMKVILQQIIIIQLSQKVFFITKLQCGVMKYITYIDNIQIKAFQKTQTVFLKG